MEEGSLSWRSMPLLECRGLHSWPHFYTFMHRHWFIPEYQYSLRLDFLSSLLMKTEFLNTPGQLAQVLAKRITPSWLSDLRVVSALCGVKFRNFEIYSLTWQKHIKELRNLMLQKKKTSHSLVKNIISHDSFYLAYNCCTVKVRNTEFYWIFVHFLMFFMFWKIKVCLGFFFFTMNWDTTSDTPPLFLFTQLILQYK